MDKKYIIVLIVAVVIVGAAVVFSRQQAAAPDAMVSKQPVMTVARYYWPGQFWIEVADSKGWFKEAGLNVELVDTNSDFTGSQEDVANGKLDTQDFYVTDLVRYAAQGKELAMVLNTDSSIGAEALVAQQGINEIADLKGKKVGVEEGSATEYMLYTLLQQKQMNFDDIERVTETTERLPERFLKGELDAVVLWDPYMTEALARPGSKKLWDTSKTPGIVSAGFVFRKDFIKTRRDDVTKFVQVWQRTTEYIKANPAESYAIVARYNNDTPENVQAFVEIDKVFDLTDNIKAFASSGGFRSLPGQIKLINLYLKNQGIIQTDVQPQQILDSSFIQALQ
jgi:NitT/TauT family transport system substrate-binding protein